MDLANLVFVWMKMGAHIVTQQVTSSWQTSHKLFASTTIFVKISGMLRGVPEHVDVAEPKEGKQGNDVPPLHPELAEP